MDYIGSAVCASRLLKAPPKTLIKAVVYAKIPAGIRRRGSGLGPVRARDGRHLSTTSATDVPIPNGMRAFSFIGLLAVVAIIGFAAKSYMQPIASHDPNDKSTVEYWVAHTGDRTAMISFCQSHQQQQDSSDCTLAIEAQTQVDAQAQHANAAQNTTGVTSASGDANDQLNAQQDANSMDTGSP